MVSAPEEVLAAARFAIPGLMPFHVRRPRLLDLLSRARSRPLVVVSAPAGTGKTSLIAEWVRGAGENHITGWISFEPDDTGFRDLLLECLRRLGLEIPVGQSLPGLATAVARGPRQLTLVLDGYETASLDLSRDVDFLLRHTFGRLRLVFVGRVDPLLPLYRYRLTDSLLEIRVADLAFTDEEAFQLLRQSGVTLSRDAVRELNERTRGWAAGLRFAALALANREDPERAVATVLAQTTDINEYLTGEVLDVQPPEVRRFLLDTCVPDVLHPELAAELGGPAAERILNGLSRSNTFIEPVPDQPGWHRYHPFFRDLLRARLRYETPQRWVDLHRRAARWFQGAGVPVQAVGQLVAVAAWDRVAACLVRDGLVGRLVLEGESGPLYQVAAGLPGHLDTPESWVVRAATALARGDRAACECALRFNGPRDGAVAGYVSVLDAVRGSLAGDTRSAARLVASAARALPAVSDPEAHCLFEFSRGVVRLRRGDLRGARQAFTDALAPDVVRHYPAMRAECLGYLALIDALEGHLSRASRIAGEAGTAAPGGSRVASVALAQVALQRYELDTARDGVTSAMTTDSASDAPIVTGIAQGVLAGVEWASGRAQAALNRLASAVAEAADDPWLANRLRVESARLSVAGGHSELALSALDAIPQPDDDPEVAVVAAAAYTEQGQVAAAADSLARVRHLQPPLPTRVAWLLVEAAAQESHQRSPDRMRATLDRSLRLAEPEGLRRPFLEAGPAVRHLLTGYPRLLLENRWLRHPDRPVRPVLPGGRVRPVPQGDGCGPELVEQLTARELQVLGCLEELLTTEEIAARMYVSVNTVRTHVRSILRKLGVSRRNAAVRKARCLGLLDGHPGIARTG